MTPIYLLGAGHAYPETEISNALLCSLNSEIRTGSILEEAGISSRRSVLPISYIEQTKNIDPEEGRKKALETPTDLGVRAAELAMKRAGVSWDQIGLIIGEAVAPLQTTPSEGQRVGGSVDVSLKGVPAYDIQQQLNSFFLVLREISNWNIDRVPQYILWVSSNTPTASIDYGQGFEGAIFGDGSAAMILSASEPRGLQLCDINFQTSGSLEYGIDIYGFLKFQNSFTPLKTEEYLRNTFYSLLSQEKFTGKGWCVPCPFCAPSRAFRKDVQQMNGKILCAVEENGYMAGASVPITISENWENFSKKKEIVCIGSGEEGNSGYAVFEVL